MAVVWIYSLISVAIVSIISLAGISALLLSGNFLRRILLFLVSFAAGALLGDVFLHLLPEAIKDIASIYQISIFILIGILSSFILEVFINWRHCHIPASESHPHSFAYINLIGDGLHNFIDGMIIAGSFLVNIPLGIATSIAVILHEIPQEIGDFAILIQAGFSRAKALLFNFFSALSALVGVVLTLIIGYQLESLSLYIISFTMGGFIYLACADLIPQLNKCENVSLKSFYPLLFFILGIGVMILFLLI